MWELDYKESWVLKNRCFWTVVLEKTLESLVDFKEIKPVNPKGIQSWLFIARTVAEVETPILWPPDGKIWLIGKGPAAGKDWRQEEKGMTEDEMVGWHYRLNGHEFEQALGVEDGQESLACCSPWGHKELDTTERLNWTEPNLPFPQVGISLSLNSSLLPFPCVGLHVGLYLTDPTLIWRFKCIIFLKKEIWCSDMGRQHLHQINQCMKCINYSVWIGGLDLGLWREARRLYFLYQWKASH